MLTIGMSTAVAALVMTTHLMANGGQSDVVGFVASLDDSTELTAVTDAIGALGSLYDPLVVITAFDQSQRLLGMQTWRQFVPEVRKALTEVGGVRAVTEAPSFNLVVGDDYDAAECAEHIHALASRSHDPILLTSELTVFGILLVQAPLAARDLLTSLDCIASVNVNHDGLLSISPSIGVRN